ncbi:alcohol dehydrogenase catalytic domain-containing protein [Nocardioides sp. zg-579]|uniref:Alcohol dehydrogenase catalytic domain-containing protein n=1 Tax=Nocardioides marmotae TaxID=2663857 RepID=A0A6I3JGD0_9ACTN|nr:NAD(P)-dependent alcohol dehydrogenase [Nocardioides marmotae]MCR6033437.1 alcohol dehydrogenase catalytic domain-containing protein [Gordonia jinghuaiqii]MTB97095.1 alcohol dehydrogenase catalytic domain-containing protein [Nocardioides marmotae]QKE00752.1 NAD(P)-dependent alcohol dehydrogenase [Nocardioides marmotae]
METTVAVVDGPGQQFRLEQVELEGPRADEVLVRIVATGLCHTDVTMASMLPAEMYPNVFGHEGAGVVEAVGPDVSGIEVGDHVVLSFRSCRQCARCRAGEVGYCDSSLMLNYMGMRMDGSTAYSRASGPVFSNFFGQSSFSRHALAYADNCVVVDQALDLTRIAPYGCGFQTGAGTVLNVLDPGPQDSLVVWGVGAVGLAAIAAAATTGTGTVVAVDLMASRLERAAALGAVTVDPGALGEQSVVDRVKELTGGGATYAIDTTAVPAVVKQAQQALGIRGELVVLGLGAEEYQLDAIDMLQNGKVVKGSIEGDSDPQVMVPRLLAMHAAGEFPVDDWIRTYPFEEINTAVQDLHDGAVVKAVLVW